MFLHPVTVESESQYGSTNMLIRLGDSMWVLFLCQINVADAMEIKWTCTSRWHKTGLGGGFIFFFTLLGEMIQFD